MREVHLAISHLTKIFGEVQALKDVSLEVPRGSFMTFLGPSGCGKTTMLRTIAGFYRPDGGDIYLDGRRLNEVPSHLRGAVMVFQDYALFPHMSVEENITYGLRLQKLPREEVRRRLERTTEYLGIRGLEKRSPGQISGGQQQRVALARALVMEPEVLLLDEPLSNLDAKLRMNIRAELRQLQRTLGITTIYVTHDQSEALALSDQIAVMNEGRVIQVGSPWEIYFRPRNAFVADFVGIANLIEGRARAAGGETGETIVDTEHGPLRVGEEPPAGEAEAVTLCCRPETIQLATRPPVEAENVLQGEIANHIFEGSHVRYWIRLGRRTLVADDREASDRGVLEGTVYLRLPPPKLHILQGQ